MIWRMKALNQFVVFGMAEPQLSRSKLSHPPDIRPFLSRDLPTFQLRDNDIRYWSDFNRVFYHPRSAVQLSQYELNSQLMPFESWSVGEELFDQLDKEEDLLDRDVRSFAEECDSMQGLQLITGADDAWGGFSSKYLESLRDEYGKTSIWVWGIEETSRATRQTRMLRSSNSARSLRSLGQQASVYIRLATVPSHLPGYVNLSSTSDWITSGLLSSALESSTLSTRLSRSQNRQASLSLLEDTLNIHGNQTLLELQLSVKHAGAQGTNGLVDGHANGGHHEDEETEPAAFDMNLFPGDPSADARIHTFAQIETKRTRLESGINDTTLDPEERMRRRHNDESIVETYESSLLFPKLDTFPENLFRTTQSGPGLELTVALKTTSTMKSKVLNLRNETARALTLDERESLYNDLTELANAYSFGWESGSDSGEDSS